MAADDPIDFEGLQAQYPDWNIVDAVRDPNSGGIWAMGADGGVFALDGAPFFGSYWSIPESGRQGTRSFVRIEANAANGGYRLLSQRGEVYESEFGDPNFQPSSGSPGTDVSTGNTPAGEPAAPGVDANQVGLSALLKEMGLETIVDDAWKFWTSMGATADMNAVNVWIRDQPSFKAKFPAMDWLESQGKYWTPKQYMDYTTTVKDSMRNAGIPTGFWDEDSDISKLIQNNWSVDEVSNAIQEAENAVLNLPAAAKAQMQSWGLTNGDMTAYWLDEDKGRTLAQRKAAQQAAQIGSAGSGVTAGMTQAEAERLRTNVGVEEATSGLERMGMLDPLFAETAEEATDLGRDTALSAVGGTAAERVAANKTLDRRRQSRVAKFEGGGGAASGGQGTTGLGSAK